MHILSPETEENDRRKYFMINLHERMLATSAVVEPATSWSLVGRRIPLDFNILLKDYEGIIGNIRGSNGMKYMMYKQSANKS